MGKIRLFLKKKLFILLAIQFVLYSSPIFGETNAPIIFLHTIAEVTPDLGYQLKQVISDRSILWKESNSVSRNQSAEHSTWLRFSLNNELSQSKKLIIMHNLATTQGIEIYQKNSSTNEFQRISVSGMSFAFNEREIPFRLPSSEISLEPGNNNFIIKVQNDGIQSIHFSVMQSEQFYRRFQNDTILVTFMLSAIAFAIIYNLFIFFHLRIAYYQKYLYYCISILITFATLTGVSQQLFLPGIASSKLYHLIPIFSSITYIFSILFAREFLQLSSLLPRWDRILKNFQYAYLFLLFAMTLEIFIYSHAKNTMLMFFLLATISPYMNLYAAYKCYRLKSNNAMAFIIAWTPLIISTVAMYFVLLGPVDWIVGADLWGIAGAAIEVFLLSWALGKRQKAETDGLHKQLEEHIVTLDQKVAEKTNKIRHILDNVNVGMFEIDQSLKIGSEFSLASLQLFNRKSISGELLSELLYPNEAKFEIELANFNNLLEITINENEFNFEINRDKFPAEIVCDNRSLILDWIPLQKNEQTVGFLVTARDISYLKKLEQENNVRNHEISILQSAIQIGPLRYQEYLNSETLSIDKAIKQFNQNKDEPNLINSGMRVLHTIKGNSATYRMKDITEYAHKAESRLKIASSAEFFPQIIIDFGELKNMYIEYLVVIDQFLPKAEQSTHFEEVIRCLYLLDEAKGCLGNQALSQQLAIVSDFFIGFIRTDIQNIIEPLILDSERVAKQLGKLPPNIEITQNEKVLFKPAVAHQMRSVFMHLIRNSIDHGLELPETRAKLNKTKAGNIIIDIDFNSPSSIVIRLYDDGSGLNIESIIAIAVKKWPNFLALKPNVESIFEVLFAPGFSSKEEVSVISGRGVGLDTVRQALEEMGGTINIIPTSKSNSTLASIDAQFIPIYFEIILPISVSVLIQRHFSKRKPHGFPIEVAI